MVALSWATELRVLADGVDNLKDIPTETMLKGTLVDSLSQHITSLPIGIEDVEKRERAKTKVRSRKGGY